MSGTEALKAQPSRMHGVTLRHSRLSDDTDEDPEAVLLSVFAQRLADLAPILAQLPDDTPLAFLLEVDSGLPEARWRRVWRQAWRESGIRQSSSPVEGSGLGIDPQRHAAIATVLVDVPMPVKQPQGLCNLDALLGHPGKASPWLAIAAAAQTIGRGAGPQFIFSGGGAATAGLWGTVLMPVPPLSK